MKNKIFDKSRILNWTTVFLAAVTGIVYALADARENSVLIISLLAAAAVFGLVICVRPVKYAEYVPFICILAAMAVFIRLAFDEVGDVLSKINMEGLSVSWIASAVLMVITACAAALATVFVKED